MKEVPLHNGLWGLSCVISHGVTPGDASARHVFKGSFLEGVLLSHASLTYRKSEGWSVFYLAQFLPGICIMDCQSG